MALKRPSAGQLIIVMTQREQLTLPYEALETLHASAVGCEKVVQSASSSGTTTGSADLVQQRSEGAAPQGPLATRCGRYRSTAFCGWIKGGVSRVKTRKRGGRQWFGVWLPLAEAGQVEAQIAVGWEYFRGELATQDLAAAERWFMAAEANRAEMGYLQLAKMLMLMGDDDRIAEVFKSRQWKTGPMVYLQARHLARNGADDAAVVAALNDGAALGHIPSKMMLLQRRNPGWRRVISLPSEIALLARLLPMWWHDRHDERVAH